MKLHHTISHTTQALNPEDWETIPFSLGGITIPVDAPDSIKSNLARLVSSTYELYSDKWMAIIREYLSNGKDIQNRIGETRPLELSLPTELEPNIRFRDFGTGLSVDRMRSFFASYGSSDKNDSNTEVGAFGIGCKSAFGIADSFGVVSYQDGKKTVYHVTKDGGFGALLRLKFEFPTDEPNGLEITIPCSSDNHDAFRSRVRVFLTDFDFPVTILNQGNLAIDKTQYVLSGNGWGLRKIGTVGSFTRIISGGVAYVVHPSNLMHRPVFTKNQYRPSNDTPKMRKLRYTISRLSMLGIDIHCQIGSVELARTREQLDYNRRLSLVLYKSLIRISSEAEAKLLELSKRVVPGDGIALREFVHTFRSSNKGFSAVLGEETIPRMNFTNVNGTTVNTSVLNTEEYLDVAIKHHLIGHKKYSRNRRSYSNKIVITQEVLSKMPIVPGIIYTFNDTGKVRGCADIIWGLAGKSAIDLVIDGTRKPVSVVEFQCRDKATFDKFLSDYDIDPARIVMFSDVVKYNPYPKPETNRKVPSTFLTINTHSYTVRSKKNGVSTMPDFWTRNEDPIPCQDQEPKRVFIKVLAERGKWVTGMDHVTSLMNSRNCDSNSILGILSKKLQELFKDEGKRVVVVGLAKRQYAGCELPSMEEFLENVRNDILTRNEKRKQRLLISEAGKRLAYRGVNHFTDLMVGQIILKNERERVSRWYDNKLTNSFTHDCAMVYELTGVDLRLLLGLPEGVQKKIETVQKKWGKRVKKIIAKNPILAYVTSAPENLIRQYIG